MSSKSPATTLGVVLLVLSARYLKLPSFSMCYWPTLKVSKYDEFSFLGNMHNHVSHLGDLDLLQCCAMASIRTGTVSSTDNQLMDRLTPHLTITDDATRYLYLR